MLLIGVSFFLVLAYLCQWVDTKTQEQNNKVINEALTEHKQIIDRLTGNEIERHILQVNFESRLKAVQGATGFELKPDNSVTKRKFTPTDEAIEELALKQLTHEEKSNHIGKSQLKWQTRAVQVCRELREQQESNS